MPHKPTIIWSHITPELDGDCACADAGSGLSTPLTPVQPAHWTLAPQLYRQPLPAAHELVFVPNGPAGAVVINAAAQTVLNAFQGATSPQAVQKQLQTQLSPTDVTHAIEQLAALGFLTPAAADHAPEPQNAHTLTVWLHLTNACNLDCTYCYLSKDHAFMTAETGRAALETIFQSAHDHSMTRVKLKYAGGEPSLNFDLLIALHEQAQALAAHYALELDEIVLSNGLSLTAAKLATLHTAGIRLMISLDTLSPALNARVFRNGRDSSLRIIQAIDRALAHGVRPHLSITINPRTAAGLADVVRFALERELTFNLNLVRDPQQQLTPADEQRLIAGLEGALAVIEQNLTRCNFLGSLFDLARFDQPHTHACGAGDNYVVIDHTGQIASCQMKMDVPLGNVWQHDPLLTIRTAPQGLHPPAVDTRADCRTCTWRYRCGGGCPILTGNGKKSPYCAVYLAIYPQILRLEGLRLLAQAAV